MKSCLAGSGVSQQHNGVYNTTVCAHLAIQGDFSRPATNAVPFKPVCIARRGGSDGGKSRVAVVVWLGACTGCSHLCQGFMSLTLVNNSN
jgi:hypothetical protein